MTGDGREILGQGAQRLAAAGIDSARVEARILLEQAMGLGRGELTTRVPTAAEREIFGQLTARRAQHEPLAYIAGEKEFWSLPFAVGPGVLVPRPETETLIEAATQAFPDRAAPLRVLDLGTGSGCLPIAFLSLYRNAQAVAVDVSPAALGWAERNVERHRLQQRCTLRQAAWSGGISGTFDVVFSNPPYVESATIATLSRDVACYEPHVALDGGADGLSAYRAIAPAIRDLLGLEGRAFVELGIGQATEVKSLFAAAGLETICLQPDLTGIQRCLVAARVA